MKKRLIHSALLSTLLLGIIAEPTLGIQSILAEEVVDEKKKEKTKKNDDLDIKEVEAGHEEDGQSQQVEQIKNSEVKSEAQGKSEKVSKSFELAPQGNVNKHRDEEYRTHTHSDKIPTGLYVENTESFTVTTDKNNVKIIIGQYGTYDYLNNNEDIGFTTYELEVGKNTITFEKGTGMIYLQNFSEEESAHVTIEETLEVPTFRINETTTEEWKEQMTRLTEAPFVELVGDYVFGTFQYNQAEDFLNPDTVNERLKYWDQVFLYQNEVIGTSLTGTGINKKHNNRVHIMNADTGAGWANAGGGRLSFHKDSGAGKSILSALPEQDQWGFWHEMGHTYQNPYYKASFLGEVTVNIPAHVVQDKLGLKNRFEGSSNVAKIQSFIETSGNKSYAIPGYDNDSNHWVWLGLFEQLRRAYGNNFYSHLNYNYRLLDNIPVPSDDEGKFQLFMKMSSQTAQRDLSEFFEKWGLYPNEDTLEEMKKYPKPNQPIWENIYNGTIVDEEMPQLNVPQATLRPGEYVIGTDEELLDPSVYYRVTDSQGNEISDFTTDWRLNPGGRSNFFDAVITDPSGNKNRRFVNDQVVRKYGNSMSINGQYVTEERLIMTLQKENKKIQTFSDLTDNRPLYNQTTGRYLKITLYDKALNEKKTASVNREDKPFDFADAWKDVPYEEGDFIHVEIDSNSRVELYENSQVTMERGSSTKEEWFKITGDTFQRLGDVLDATPVEHSINIGSKVEAKDFVKDIVDNFSPEKVEVNFDKEPNWNVTGEQTVKIKLTNWSGQTKVIETKLIINYDNALSISGQYVNDERLIMTLQKESKEIQTFSNLADDRPLYNQTEGQYLKITLYDQELREKKTASVNREDKPFDFADAWKDVPYEEGDIIQMEISISGRVELYENSQVTMEREASTREEWFHIKDDSFERFDYAPQGTPVEVETTIGQEVKPEDFVKDITDSFDASKVSLDYLKVPNTGLPGEQEVIVELTNLAGKKTSVKSKITVNHGTDMTIRGERTKERMFITLQKSTQTIEAFTNELDTSPIDIGSGIHTTFTLFDSGLEIKKEAIANEEDTPEKFVKSLKNISYQEGDWVKVTTHYTNKISTYQEGTLTLPSSETAQEEWFVIKDNTFERVDYAPHGTSVEVETTIGQKVDAKALVQDITDAFDSEDVQVTFEKEPNVNKSGDVTASLLLTNKMGYQTKLQSVIHVGYGNALSLRAYAVSDERAVIRLDKDKQTIETFANPDRQTPIDGSNGLAWKVTLYDGKTNAVKKEVSAQREDLPFDFATSLSNVSYENGDYIKLYNRRSGFTFNYRNNEQTDEAFGIDEYLVIQNDQFVKMTNEAPTLQSEDTISYERGMLISPEQFLEDIQAKTQAGNQLTTTFDENTLKEVGEVQVEVKATNPISQEEVSKTVIVTVTPSTLAYNEYKRSYWRDYGFVLEGNAGIQDKAFPSKDSVTKVLEILDDKGQIVDTIQAVNTNWYEPLNYSGYQVNISYTKLQALGAGNYSLQMHVTGTDGLDEVLPITSPLNLFGWTGDFQDDMSQIASGFAGKNVLDFTETNRTLGLTVTHGDAVFNKLSKYVAASGNHVIDGWIATDFDFQTTHTKELIIEDSDGNEVLRKTAPTWDITQTFKVDVKAEWKRSGFQASVPADKAGNGNQYFIEIKDNTGNTITKTEIK